MTLPFSISEFLAVFADYNRAIWPFQIFAYGLGLVAVVAILIPRQGTLRLALAAFALLWAFVGIGYHLMFFSSINPAAWVFAGFFVLQAAMFLASALWPADLRLQPDRSLRTAVGLAVGLYAVAVYPALGFWAGHGGMAGPMFGVAPCPTTMFTIGFLLMSRGIWVIWLSIIPILWSLIGVAAALQLGIPEDLMMPLAGIALGVVLGHAGWRQRTTRTGGTGKPA
jgi:Family of unknown function (DUF6064)